MKILSQNTWKSRGVKFTHQAVELGDCDLQIALSKSDVKIGIDPGTTNVGIAVISDGIDCFELTFPSERLAIPRALTIRLGLTDLVYGYQPLWDKLSVAVDILVAVEASAYSMRFRNTELAEGRITQSMWFVDNFNLPPEQCIFLTPQAIRKSVFGNGKTKAEAVWSEIKPDAASALAVALAGLKLTLP